MNKFLAVVRGLAFVVTALAVADVVGIAVSRRLSSPDAAFLPEASARANAPRPVNTNSLVRPVTARNLFGADLGQGKEPVGPVTPIAESLPDCQIGRRYTLVGTFVGGRGGAVSQAILEEKGGEQILQRIADVLGDAGEILTIEPRRLVVDEAGRECEIRLDLGESGISARKPSTGVVTADTDDQAIRKDDNGYTLDQDFVQEQLSNLSELITNVRAVPNFRDGQTDGFRLFSIKRGSIFDKVGLRNGDVVRRINEYDLSQFENDPAVALQVFSELKNARDFQVTVFRNGQEDTVNYQIR